LDNPGLSRKAFRLCICADDCDRFLNASMWPDSVVISDWILNQRAIQLTLLTLIIVIQERLHLTILTGVFK